MFPNLLSQKLKQYNIRKDDFFLSQSLISFQEMDAGIGFDGIVVALDRTDFSGLGIAREFFF